MTATMVVARGTSAAPIAGGISNPRGVSTQAAREIITMLWPAPHQFGRLSCGEALCLAGVDQILFAPRVDRLVADPAIGSDRRHRPPSSDQTEDVVGPAGRIDVDESDLSGPPGLVEQVLEQWQGLNVIGASIEVEQRDFHGGEPIDPTQPRRSNPQRWAFGPSAADDAVA